MRITRPLALSGLGLTLSLALLVPGARLLAAEPVKTAPAIHKVLLPDELVDMPECTTLYDYVSEAELGSLRGMGLSNERIAALALIAHHGKQPVLELARRHQEGESVNALAANYGLPAGTVLASSRWLARDLAQEDVKSATRPVKQKVAGKRMEQREKKPAPRR
jgi:hypothetical protein